MERFFTGYALQEALVGLAALVLLAFAPHLQKRYGSRWLCRLWLILAALFLLPVRLLLPAAPTPVELPTPAALTAPVTLPTGGQELLPRQEAPLKENTSAPAAPAAGQGSPVSPPAAPPLAGPGDFSGTSRPLAHTPGLRLPAWSPLGWVAFVWLAGAAGMLLWRL